MSDDDDNGIDVVGEDVPLADESIYPERIGHHKIVQVYLNPDQVEENAGFLKAFLCARFVWVMVVGGNYASDDVTPAPLLSTFDYGFRKLKFIDLVEEPLTFKSCGVFRE